MRIRKARLSDLAAIRRMSDRHGFETNRDWKGSISSKTSEMFVLLDRDAIIGFTGLLYHDWNNTLQLMDVFVEPERRKLGLGLMLVKAMIERAKRTGYRCLIAEAPSKNRMDLFYKKLGFRKCGYNDRYYSNDSKGKSGIAIWMSLDLK